METITTFFNRNERDKMKDAWMYLLGWCMGLAFGFWLCAL